MPVAAQHVFAHVCLWRVCRAALAPETRAALWRERTRVRRWLNLQHAFARAFSVCRTRTAALSGSARAEGGGGGGPLGRRGGGGKRCFRALRPAPPNRGFSPRVGAVVVELGRVHALVLGAQRVKCREQLLHPRTLPPAPPGPAAHGQRPLSSATAQPPARAPTSTRPRLLLRLGGRCGDGALTGQCTRLMRALAVASALAVVACPHHTRPFQS
jgi:hypothetical protein